MLKELQVETKEYEVLVHNELARLRSDPRYQDTRCLIRYGYKVFSQNDEDGIIREIFKRIDVTNNVFVEFGIGDGLENNTLALLFDGWSGLWIDASTNSIQKISDNYSAIIKRGSLKIVEAFITRENINELISANIVHKDIDLLSIDIDGNDYHILDAITCISPRVLVIEYNAKFAPPILYCMDYDEKHVWQSDDCYGASLKFLEVNIEKKGYYLVGCNLTGTNAFFVKKIS